ncbi:MAG: hypothetical protein JWQ03_1627 [Variovorax sp.]|nr:hypothetical protein [Variovorax sp.]
MKHALDLILLASVVLAGVVFFALPITMVVAGSLPKGWSR